MSTIRLWVCDGCDREARTDEDLPENWAHWAVRIGDVWRGDYHLCLDCQETILAKADPKNWERRAVARAARTGT